MSQPVSLTIIDDGPIKVSGDAVSFAFDGATLDTKDGADVYLCRCGQSANAPFCDGTHSKVGFKAEPAAAPTKEIRVWEGRSIKTYFNPNACMHVYKCKPLNALRERELAGEDIALEIAKVVQDCPSGALSFEAANISEADVAITGRPHVDIQAGGEIRIQRQFEINAPLNEKQDDERATLCRCGRSANKPWCDGQHAKRKDFR